MDTQRIAHHLVLAQVAQRLGERPGQLTDLVTGERFRVEGVQILFDRRRQGQLLTDARETRVQHGGERQVWIARGVGGAKLDPDGATVAASRPRHANQCRAVHLRPGDRDRGFEAGHEALVRIDQRCDQRAQPARVRQLAGDEVLGDRRELVLVGAIVKRIGFLTEVGKGLVGMHPGAGRAEDWLGHEGRQQASSLRHGLDRVLQGDEMVGASQRIAEGEVELVLPCRDLVMAGLDRDAQVVERADDLLADIAGDVDWMVEVAGPVVPSRTNAAAGGIGVEQEELEFGRDCVIEPEGVSLRQCPRQHAARITGEPLAVRGQQITDHLGPQDAIGIADGQGVEVGTQEHVALEDPGESLDR